MDRIALINYLIVQQKEKGYLEITCHDKQNTFTHIQSLNKEMNFPDSSDDFFKHNKKKFDVIFIDGIHTEDQTKNDVNNALRCLAKNGVIIIHDCMPPDVWHQREHSEYKQGENWNGTVWKAVLRIFNSSSFACTLLDTDWGCGIIDTSKRQIPRQLDFPEALNYELHYPALLKYKVSIAEYFRKQIKVFYHLACIGNWQQVFEEQMQKLKENGFNKIELTVLGTEENLQFVKVLCKKINLEIHIAFQSAELTCFETPALLAIEDYAKKNEGYVLYLHSKGVSNPADINKTKWRRLMMKELIENWEYCMLQLSKYDAIGVNWREMVPVSHYCGNFWYASTIYLRKLVGFKDYYYNTTHHVGDAIDPRRLNCEFWISSSVEPPKLLSLYCRDTDFCNRDFWRNK